MLRRAAILVLVVVGCASPARPVAVAEPAPEPKAQAPEPQAQADPTPAPQPSPPPEAEPDDCNPFIAPLERSGGALVVHAPPKKPARAFHARMRTHVEGSLSADSRRVWVGPQVPGFVPLTEGTLELFLLDHQPDGSFVALYRDPYDASSCGLGGAENCAYVVTAFERCGEVRWSLALGDLFSRPDHLEVQDLRLVDGTLYFNEACQSYSKQAGGSCSSLVAVDPAQGAVLWRSKPLVSNGRFFVDGDFIIAGYGFTAERDTLKIVRRSDGEVMQTLRLPKAPETIERLEPGVVSVTVYPGDTSLHYRMQGWDTPTPRLERLR